MTSYRHVALLAGDLRATEAHYTHLLEMERLFREGPLPDGRWASPPPHAGWDDVEAADVEIVNRVHRRDVLPAPLTLQPAVPCSPSPSLMVLDMLEVMLIEATESLETRPAPHHTTWFPV